jgi:hypothetical protein
MAIPDELRKQVEALVALQAEGVAVYTPIVDDLIGSQCRDRPTLERTIDGILDFACTADGAMLYRRLCRYIWGFNPELAAWAANAYRELWDPDEERPWQNKQNDGGQSGPVRALQEANDICERGAGDAQGR